MRSIKLPSWTERLLGLEPVPVPPQVFALDGAHLRYGQFQHRSDGVSFESYRLFELPPSTFGEGPLGAPLRDPAAFVEWLAPQIAPLLPAARVASLVLPDAWLRLIFSELSELPTKAEQREAVVRWKLKRLVPFRVEDLRVSAVEVTSLPGQDEPLRVLLGFGIELLLEQLETAFAAAGVRLGVITNATLATLAGLEGALDPAALSAVVLVDEDSYTVSFVRAGEPLLYRYKEIGEVPEHEREATVRRDLRLTRSFVADHVPSDGAVDGTIDGTVAVAAAGGPGRVLLTAPLEQEERWLAWIEEELGSTPEPLSFQHVPLVRAQADLSWSETAALYGAVALEVA